MRPGARLRLSFLSAPPELKAMEEKVAVVRQAKEQAIADQDFEAAATKRDEEKKLTAEKVRMEKEFRDGSLDTPGVVDEALIAELLLRQLVFHYSSWARTKAPSLSTWRTVSTSESLARSRRSPRFQRPFVASVQG